MKTTDRFPHHHQLLITRSTPWDNKSLAVAFEGGLSTQLKPSDAKKVRDGASEKFACSHSMDFAKCHLCQSNKSCKL